MAAFHYLTVQDMLWINLQVTNRVNHYNFARLEEATYYQYSYGESKDLVVQAGRLASGFPKLHPFDAGNAATAFVGTLVFLSVNRVSLNLSDGQAADWFEKILDRSQSGAEAIQPMLRSGLAYGHSEADVRSAIQDVLDEFPCSILCLAKQL